MTKSLIGIYAFQPNTTSRLSHQPLIKTTTQLMASTNSLRNTLRASPLHKENFFGSILDEVNTLCSFSPNFGDGRLNECGNFSTHKSWYAKYCLWQTFTRPCYAITPLSLSQQGPMLGNAGAGSTPVPKADPLTLHPSPEVMCCDATCQQQHCTDSSGYIQKWVVH